MFRSRWALAIPIFAVVVSTSLGAAEGGDYTIRSNPSEVRVLFTAADAQGRRMTQLEPKDVAVIDNDEVIRRFRSFAPASETPLQVLLLIDISSSIGTQMAGEFDLVRTFIGSGKWRAEDEVSIIVFGGTQEKLIFRGTCREGSLSLDTRSQGGVTPLYDAVASASELLSKMRDRNARAAIIVLSDGADNFSAHSLRDAITAAQDAEASVYTVNSRGKRTEDRGDAILEQIAAETGGVSYAPGKGTAEALDAVLDDLHQGFVLTYELPRAASARHQIRVVPALNSKLQFRSRKGYAFTRDALR